jgi:membrane fusion protein, copper/silver efflux system
MLRMAQVRLRFPLVLLVAFFVVGRWEDLRNGWTRIAHVANRGDAGSSPISENTEYFCPMDPGVVSNWPGRCGVCNMALVRRKKGEAVALPDGVVARMQLSPYRMQLAGIRTAPISYRPLAREIEIAGRVSSITPRRLVDAELDAIDAAELTEGTSVFVSAEENAGLPAAKGRVRSLTTGSQASPTAVMEFDEAEGAWRVGAPVRVRASVAIALREPFCSQPSDMPAPRPNDLRSTYACPDHPDSIYLKAGRCPIDQIRLEKRALSAHQRIGWWCPMHPKVTGDHSGEKCKECGGMELVPRTINYRPPGEVLAVPESAVIDTGKSTLVFVERTPGMFDGVEVVLGPRCGNEFPVVSGLESGQRVAATGAFLIDAETRLNPSLAASYFGAARSAPATPPAAAPAGVAAARPLCPVTRKPLGSMGPPVVIDVAGRKVSLCCEACEAPIRANPAKYLGSVPSPPPPSAARQSSGP